MINRIDITTLILSCGISLLGLTGCISLDEEGFLYTADGFDSGSCLPGFSNGFGCESACDASNTVIIEGNNYCTTGCEFDGFCPSGHICVMLDSSIPPSICLPPCSTGSDCPAGFLQICGPENVCGL